MDKSTKDQFQYGLGALVVLLFFTLLFFLLFVAVPETNKTAFDILLGILSGMVGAVIGYFFGSSKGSSEKTEMMANKP